MALPPEECDEVVAAVAAGRRTAASMSRQGLSRESRASIPSAIA
jgi:hypothetical protein